MVFRCACNDSVETVRRYRTAIITLKEGDSVAGKLLSRLISAGRVLRGVRPVAARYDTSDDLIAQNVSLVTADVVFFELAWNKETLEMFEGAWDVVHLHVRKAVYEAIREYVSHVGVAAQQTAPAGNSDGESEPIPF